MTVLNDKKQTTLKQLLIKERDDLLALSLEHKDDRALLN